MPKPDKKTELLSSFTSCEGYLFSMARRLTENNEDARDLLQDTFLKALEHAETFRGEASLKTWLSKILFNTFLTQKRKKKEHVSMALDTLPAPEQSANPEKVVVKRELAWCIRQTLSQHLPKRYRAVLVMRDINGQSYNEIAETLEVSLATVKSLVYRSRRAFRRHLERSGCYAYVKDYRCICDGVSDGNFPLSSCRNDEDDSIIMR